MMYCHKIYCLSNYCALAVFLVIAVSGPDRSVAQENEKAQPHQGEQPNEQAAPSDPLGRSTPHGTVVGFLQAAQSSKYQQATQYLQLSKSERALKGEGLAQQLHELMDEAFVGRAGPISNRREGSAATGVQENHELIGTFRVDDTTIDVELVRVNDARGNEIWLFSSQTLASVPKLADQLDTDRLESKLPAFLATRWILHTPLWRWLVFLLLIPVSYALAWGVVRLSQAGFRAWLRRRPRPVLKDMVRSAAVPSQR